MEGTLVVQVSATDEDSGQNGAIDYSIVNCSDFSKTACLLTIDSNTGAYNASTDLSCDLFNSYYTTVLRYFYF